MISQTVQNAFQHKRFTDSISIQLSTASCSPLHSDAGSQDPRREGFVETSHIFRLKVFVTLQYDWSSAIVMMGVCSTCMRKKYVGAFFDCSSLCTTFRNWLQEMKKQQFSHVSLQSYCNQVAQRWSSGIPLDLSTPCKLWSSGTNVVNPLTPSTILVSKKFEHARRVRRWFETFIAAEPIQPSQMTN